MRRFGRIGGLIGGSYNCRICGSYHSSAVAHTEDEISLPQKIQMSIEGLERVLDEITFKEPGRKKVKNFFKELRKKLGIPNKRIYARDKDISNTGIPLIRMKTILKENLRVLEGILKEEAFMNQSEAEDLEKSFAKFKDRIADI